MASSKVKSAQITSATPDAHAASHNGGADAVTPAGIGAAVSSHTHTHTSTTGQTVDDHHAKSHVHTGDGSGTVAYSSLSGPPTIPPLGSATPLIESGSGAVGTATNSAREDHVHPALGLTSDTSARVYNSAVQSIPNATPTMATFDSEAWDTAALHSTSSNTSRLTAPSGTNLHWHVTILGLWASSATGTRTAEIVKNGSTVLATMDIGALSTADNIPSLSCDAELSSGDYVEARFTQNSLGALDLTAVFSMFLTGTGGSGGGATISSTAVGSEPGSPTTGDLDFYSDGAATARYSGSAWVPWGPLFPLTKPPAASSWTWVNQGGASRADVAGGVSLVRSVSDSGDNMRLLKVSAASTPYVVTAALISLAAGSDTELGLIFRESSSGKIVTFNHRPNASGPKNILITTYTNPTTGVSDIYGVYWSIRSPLLWMRITDNGTNRVYSLSADGQTWLDIYSETRTTFLTADEYGWQVNAIAGPVAATLLSWKIT